MNSHFHFWPVTRISYEFAGGVLRSRYTLNPHAKMNTTMAIGINVHVSSSAVLWCALSSASSRPGRRRYRTTNATMSATIKTKKNTDTQKMKLKTRSTGSAPAEACTGIQKVPSVWIAAQLNSRSRMSCPRLNASLPCPSPPPQRSGGRS